MNHSGENSNLSRQPHITRVHVFTAMYFCRHSELQFHIFVYTGFKHNKIVFSAKVLLAVCTFGF